MPDFVCKPSQYSLLRRANLYGFAALPAELFLEVLSHFPLNPVSNSAASIRRETLRSLSEVCQNLRRVFRPHLWQRIEVYTGMWVGGKYLYQIVKRGKRSRKDFAKELLRQLNIVTIQDPDLARCVQIVDIEVNAATFRPVFDALGRCFSLFPNLHTVKIITTFSHTHEAAMAAIKRGFKKKILYPQIRSAILSPSVYPLLAVCPNLESFTTFEESPFLFSFLRWLPALQTLSCPISLTSAKVIADELTSLRQITISLDDSLYDDDQICMTHLLETIRLFPNLRTLIIHRDVYRYWVETSTKSVESVFRNLPPSHCKNLKEVIFMGYPGEQEEILVLSES